LQGVQARPSAGNGRVRHFYGYAAEEAPMGDQGTQMSRFQITLVRPEGFLHTEAFREVAETLQFGFRSLGHTAQIQENVFDATATNVLLGSHLLSLQQASEIPAGSVIYNLEQLGGPSLPAQFYELARHHRIWDYSPQNIKQWKAISCARPPILVPLGYVPELSRIQSSKVQDIDVLFYGSSNQRRIQIVKALEDSGVAVRTLFGVYGRERDEVIARSKIVLNIHFYEAKVFEVVRVSYLLANSKAVVTESCTDPGVEEGLAGSVMSCPYEALVEKCLSLLKNDEERRRLESRGFEWFSYRKESEILSKALQESQNSASDTREVQVPTKLNLGSGKDWRDDHFNVDIDGYWQPDAVLDFNRPLPIGQLLETERFGAVLLENNSFDEILANDSLEHIPSLMTAMNSCLNLLKVGGLFRISVPYDLSWGAWQDPTHVRAFNERSWLYYTDWFCTWAGRKRALISHNLI
jgi:hypothetical protein